MRLDERGRDDMRREETRRYLSLLTLHPVLTQPVFPTNVCKAYILYSLNTGVDAQLSDGAVAHLFLCHTVKTNTIKKAKAILSKTPIKGLFTVSLRNVVTKQT